MDEIVKTACAADFPKNKTKVDYYPIVGNDVMQFTKSYKAYLDSTVDQAPK
jgi:hypothetical protein